MNLLKYTAAALTTLTLGIGACSNNEPLVHYRPSTPEPGPEPGKYKVVCDFETLDLGFQTNDALQYDVVENPSPEGINTSAHCGQVVSAGGEWELIYSEVMETPFDFTADGAKFTMKTRSPKIGGPVYFKLESSSGAPAQEVTDVTTTVAGEWETLTFDFSSRNLPDGMYDKIVLLFDAGRTGSGETWLFDDIFQMRGEQTDPDPTPDPGEAEYENFCDFESRSIDFRTNGDLQFRRIENPRKEGIDTSDHVGEVVSAGGQWELIYSGSLGEPFRFSENGAKFTMKTLSPKAGGHIYFKLEQFGGSQSVEITDVTTTVAGEWETLTFDFTPYNLPDGVYDQIVLLFDAGQTGSGERWLFDDITGPKRDAAPALFTRYAGNPVLKHQGAPRWRSEHIANAAILTPDESPDGRWRMYVRGSGYTAQNEYHDQIGVFYQDPDAFSPTGLWTEYPSNPVIAHGAPGTCDELHLLDCAPCIGADGRVWFFYQAVRGTLDRKQGSLACRHATDDEGYRFTEAVQLKDGVGCSDAVYHDGRYYIFYGYGYDDNTRMKIDCAVTDDPLSLAEAEVHTVLLPGGGPDDFDARYVNGSRIFRLEGIDKWFMVYQGSARNFDFPERFHVAWSDDLLHWTKVQNEQPLFERGEAGRWDQGAIWFGEVFEHEGMLYLYYEAWGCEGAVPDRDTPYFGGGHSATGCASASKEAFLTWCGLE